MKRKKTKTPHKTIADELADYEKDEARELFDEFVEQSAEEDEAACRVASAVDRLRDKYGIDASDPPDWLKQEGGD